MALNPVIIKLEEGMLNLTEQSSAKRKPEYLQRCLDTLCDLSEALEAAQRMKETTAGRRRRSR